MRTFLQDYTDEELRQIIMHHIDSSMSQSDYKIEVNSLYIVGSRVQQTNREDSDLDVIIIYSDEMPDYVVHEILNEDHLLIEDIVIDFIPFQYEVQVKKDFIKLL